MFEVCLGVGGFCEGYGEATARQGVLGKCQYMVKGDEKIEVDVINTMAPRTYVDIHCAVETV